MGTSNHIYFYYLSDSNIQLRLRAIDRSVDQDKELKFKKSRKKTWFQNTGRFSYGVYPVISLVGKGWLWDREIDETN